MIQRVSGQPYEQYVRQHVLRPAGISRHGTGAAGPFLRSQRGAALRPRRAEGVSGRARSDRSAGRQLDRLGGGHGAFLTAVDGSRGKSLLSPAVYREMLAAPPAPLKPRKDGGAFRPGLGRGAARPRRHPLQQERRRARHPHLHRALAQRRRLGRVAQRRRTPGGQAVAAGLSAPSGCARLSRARSVGRRATCSSGIPPPAALPARIRHGCCRRTRSPGRETQGSA